MTRFLKKSKTHIGIIYHMNIIKSTLSLLMIWLRSLTGASIYTKVTAYIQRHHQGVLSLIIELI